MSDIEFSTVKAPSYPKGKVIGIYGLLGGAIGGFIVFLYMLVIDGNIFRQELTDIFKMLLASIVGGFFFGLLPTLVAGLTICKLKIVFDSILKIVPLFFIGFFSTFIFSVWIMLDEIVSEKIISALLFSLIGGASAVVTGLIALPKYK
ncbi:hypothetical protein IOD06_08175 [Psychrobacter sp. N25K4-3-2]|uniref:hypothetical protein n=1 Tax=Psychrobacter sp. N25K4-3-2 TaxID=2785026 RepID=UPI00188B6355|nr:hypothetical protein [Psychrobacter sp. N25K4-3-2]MBF4489862.1 hypothetical protein [Psychrobacter sp. N25K4-3-2]